MIRNFFLIFAGLLAGAALGLSAAYFLTYMLFEVFYILEYSDGLADISMFLFFAQIFVLVGSVGCAFFMVVRAKSKGMESSMMWAGLVILLAISLWVAQDVIQAMKS